jgi:hypothetical protein
LRRHRRATTARSCKPLANGELKLDKKGTLRAAGPVMVPIEARAGAPIKVAQVDAVAAARARVAAPVRERHAVKLYTCARATRSTASRSAHRTTVRCAPRAEQALGERHDPAGLKLEASLTMLDPGSPCGRPG